MTNSLKTFKAAARFLTISTVAAAAMFAMTPAAQASTHGHRHHTTKHRVVKHHKVARKTVKKVTVKKVVKKATVKTAAISTNYAAGDLYVSTTTPAAQALATATGSTRDALAKIAAQPQAKWLAGPWVNASNAKSWTEKITAGAAATGTVLPMVVYNIPHRDCGQYSSGGAASATAYQQWIDQVAAGIGATNTMVIVEPDALGQLNCLSAAQQTERFGLLHYAVSTLSAQPNTKVYLDAGNANWKSPAVIAESLKAAGVADADGFSLNVSNFDTTANEVAYGQQVSALVGGKHFVVDTSRNGNGVTATGKLAWCNPAGAALGARPTINPGIAGVDALLWVKTVGVSDGNCHAGDAPAGTFSVSYATGLATRAHW